ncbi:MAG TPA: L-threonylcarbamoyladenylate synthase [Bacteroidia bacterium]|nr:L-threonylcarbamoyladenylate synthase [Bacteroidia bacterium]
MDNLLPEINKAAEVLRAGGIIIYPTDTIWGIGCDATNDDAVKKIFSLKKRVDSKSMIILLESSNRLESYVQRVPEQAWQLIEYSEKPLSIVYDNARNLANSVIAEDGSICIRITKDEFCKKLIGKLRKPIVSTSANLSREKAPANYYEIPESILKGADYVVNLRREEKSNPKPSTIIRLRENGQIEFLRK